MRPRHPSHLTTYCGLSKAQLAGLRRSAAAGKRGKLAEYNRTITTLVECILAPVADLCSAKGQDGQYICTSPRVYLFAVNRIKAARKFAALSIGALVSETIGPLTTIHGPGGAFQIVLVTNPPEALPTPEWTRTALWVEKEEVAA